MALSKTKISIPLSAGLETKTDDSQDQLSGLRDLENVIFDTPKKLRKRQGYTLVNNRTLDNTSLSSGKFLARFEDELGQFTNTNYYARSESIDRWTNKGRVFSAFPESRTIVRNDKEQKNIDTLSVENINVYSYEDSSGTRVTLIDNINNNFLLSNSLVSATGERPRISNIQNTIFIFYIDGTDLKYRKVNVIDPETIVAEQTFANDVDSTDKKFDIVTIGDKIFVAYQSSDSGGVIKAATVDSGDNISSVITITGESGSDALSVNTDSSSRFILTYSDGTDAKILIYSFTLGVQIVSPTSLETISNVTNMCAIESPTQGTYNIFYEISAASVKNHYIKQNTIDLSASVGTPSILLRSVGLASKPFIHNNIVYINAIHESTLQSTYFTVDTNANIVSKISPNIGGELNSENVLTKVASLGDSNYLFGSQLKGRSVIDEDEFFSLLGVNQTTLDFDLDKPFQNEELGKNLHIAGGIPMMYDGSSIVEHSFHLFPEDLADGGTSTTGGSLSDGAYQYAAVYAWTDNKGILHRSAPSIGLPITLSGGTSTQQQDIEVPTLRLTQKEDVVIELYRTEAAGTIFYKITEVDSPVSNDKTTDIVTINDTLSDADLIDNEVLYTTGGVLDNIAAPACSIIESASNRIFLAGLEDGNKIAFSKIRFDGFPVEFNDGLTLQVNSKGGPITALKTMDEKVIIFKESAIFYLSGDGPNNIGQQDTFINPELISSDIGCTNVNSVVLTPQGLMFKSSKGIYLLDRSLNLTYIGANVEAFNDLSITSAIVVPEENQVRFTTLDGDSLVYNYYVGNWATFTNNRALSAINIRFTYYYLRFDGTIYVEAEDSYTDNGSPIEMALESGWISFADIQGFQRVYRMMLLGEFKSPHKIRVRIAYDFNEAFVQEVIIDTADFNDNTRYGGYSPYGTGTPYGGNGNVHQMRIDLKRQKCQAIKIRIEEIQHDESNLGEGLQLSNISFEVGQKTGMNKIDTGRKYGTS
jgi:hypothetical protein